MSEHTPYPGQYPGQSGQYPGQPPGQPPSQPPGQQPGGGFPPPQQPPQPPKKNKALPWILGCGGLALIVFIAAIGIGGYLLVSNSGNSANQPSARPTPTKPQAKYAKIPFKPCRGMRKTAYELVPDSDPHSFKSPLGGEVTCSWRKDNYSTEIANTVEIGLVAAGGRSPLRTAKKHFQKVTDMENKRAVPNLGNEAYIGKAKTSSYPEVTLKVRTSNLIIDIHYSEYYFVGSQDGELATPVSELNKTAIKVARKALQKSQ